MPKLLLWDHLFALYVSVVFPLYAWRTFPVEARAIRAGGEAARIRAYRRTVATWLGHLAVLGALWIVAGRPWADLGFRASGAWQLAAAFGLGAVVIAGMVANGRSLVPLGREGIERTLGDLATFLPRTPREERWFQVMSVNAGITEELIYRAFLFWYLAPFTGTTWAAVVTVVVFSLAHSYQGVRQVPGVALVAAWLIGLYLLSGSIFLPILFHALADVVQGRNIVNAMRE